jgi:hypothetical protein
MIIGNLHYSQATERLFTFLIWRLVESFLVFKYSSKTNQSGSFEENEL